MENKTITLYLVETSPGPNGDSYYTIEDSFCDAKIEERNFFIDFPDVTVSIYGKEISMTDLEKADGDYYYFYDELYAAENLLSKWTKNECLFCKSTEYHHYEPSVEIKTILKLIDQDN